MELLREYVGLQRRDDCDDEEGKWKRRTDGERSMIKTTRVIRMKNEEEGLLMEWSPELMRSSG
jgi:hypothetical protein